MRTIYIDIKNDKTHSKIAKAIYLKINLFKNK